MTPPRNIRAFNLPQLPADSEPAPTQGQNPEDVQKRVTEYYQNLVEGSKDQTDTSQNKQPTMKEKVIYLAKEWNKNMSLSYQVENFKKSGDDGYKVIRALQDGDYSRARALLKDFFTNMLKRPE